MPGYGVSRGTSFSSSSQQYNPLRGNNVLNEDIYSSLHFKSTHNNPQPPSNRPQPSSHSVSNPCTTNPYLAIINARPHNKSKNHLPDLSAPRSQPQPIATPPRPKKPSQIQSTNGWKFTAFLKPLKSAWNWLGTPSKSKSSTSRRVSMSQPPHSPLHHNQPNTYHLTEIERPITAPDRNSKPSLQTATTEPIMDDPHTPPSQTRQNMSQLLSQPAPVAQDNNANTSNARNDGSAVINIHNLLQKTKLSPDDAAWLHSKIDQCTHDRYDGSLSYIGPPVRAASLSLVQQLSFDDAATENSYKSTHSIYSPLRSTKSNIIPHTAAVSSRYAPHPPNYHVSSRIDDKHIRKRKRPRGAVFNDDDEDELMVNGHQQRKRMRYSTKSSYLRRSSRPFRDNYLRPVGPIQSSIKIVPKYNDLESKRLNKDEAEKEKERKEEIQAVIDIKETKTDAKRHGFCFPNKDTKTTTINVVTMNGDSNVTRNGNKSSLNGFGSHKHSQNDSEESSENIVMDVDIKENKPLKRRHNHRSPLKDKKLANCLNKIQKQSTDKDKDEDNDDDDLLDKKKGINDDDDDEDENMKKKQTVSPTPKSPKNNGKIASKTVSKTSPRRKKKKNMQSTPISKAFNIANDMVINHKKPGDIESVDKDNGTMANQEQKTDPIHNTEDVAVETNHETVIHTGDTKAATQSPTQKQTENESTKDEDKEDKPKKCKGSYMMMIMSQRKKRYIAAYTKRLKRIYKEYQASKLDKVEGFVLKYGVDADKIHDLYSKICGKYHLKPCAKYEGSEHEAEPVENEKEGPAQQETPEQNLSQSLNDENADKKVANTEKQSSFSFVRPEAQPFETFNTDSNNKETVGKEEKKENKKKEGFTSWNFNAFAKKSETKENKKPPQPSFDNAPNPFGLMDKKQTNGNDNMLGVTDHKGNVTEPIQSKTNTASSNDKKDLFSQLPLQFSIPNMSFSDSTAGNGNGNANGNKAKNDDNKDMNRNGMFSATNSSFQFTDSKNNAVKPSLTVSKTEPIQDNNTTNKKRTWSMDGDTSGSWNAKKDKGEPNTFGWNANNNDSKSQNNTFPWANGTANNDNKSSGFSSPWKNGNGSTNQWSNNNKANDTISGFNTDHNNSNKNKNNSKNSGFSTWNNKSNNNNNSPAPNNAKNNGFTPSFNTNSNANNWTSKATPNAFNTFPSNNNNTNNMNDNNAGNSSGWSFGGGNNMNSDNNNNNASNAAPNSNGFKFAPPNNSANANSANSDNNNSNNNNNNNGFFQMQTSKNKNRPVFRAKRRLK